MSRGVYIHYVTPRAMELFQLNISQYFNEFKFTEEKILKED